MILFDNIIFSLQKYGGISAVWSELLSRYIRNPISDYICTEYESKHNIFRSSLFIPPNRIKHLSNRFLWFKRYLNLKYHSSDRFIFHSSYYRICKSHNAINITTVHDFTYEYFFSGIKKYIHSWQKKKAIKNSDYVICVSENTKQDLLRFLPEVNHSKPYVIYNGVSDDYFPITRKEDIHYDIPQHPYVLFVGGRVSYKNFDLVVNALTDTKYSLVIVGKPLTSSELQFIHSRIPKDRFFSYSDIDNSTLNILYNHAFCLLYPSSYEGFGIPVLEAQKAGCPVIAYNAFSIPEIIGDKTLLLNELTVENIHEMFAILESDESREHIISLGLSNVKEYTWDKMYSQVLALYKDALGLN